MQRQFHSDGSYNEVYFDEKGQISEIIYYDSNGNVIRLEEEDEEDVKTNKDVNPLKRSASYLMAVSLIAFIAMELILPAVSEASGANPISRAMLTSFASIPFVLGIIALSVLIYQLRVKVLAKKEGNSNGTGRVKTKWLFVVVLAVFVFGMIFIKNIGFRKTPDMNPPETMQIEKSEEQMPADFHKIVRRVKKRNYGIPEPSSPKDIKLPEEMRDFEGLRFLYESLDGRTEFYESPYGKFEKIGFRYYSDGALSQIIGYDARGNTYKIYRSWSWGNFYVYSYTDDLKKDMRCNYDQTGKFISQSKYNDDEDPIWRDVWVDGNWYHDTYEYASNGALKKETNWNFDATILLKEQVYDPETFRLLTETNSDESFIEHEYALSSGTSDEEIWDWRQFSHHYDPNGELVKTVEFDEGGNVIDIVDANGNSVQIIQNGEDGAYYFYTMERGKRNEFHYSPDDKLVKKVQYDGTRITGITERISPTEEKSTSISEDGSYRLRYVGIDEDGDFSEWKRLECFDPKRRITKRVNYETQECSLFEYPAGEPHYIEHCYDYKDLETLIKSIRHPYPEDKNSGVYDPHYNVSGTEDMKQDSTVKPGNDNGMKLGAAGFAAASAILLFPAIANAWDGSRITSAFFRSPIIQYVSTHFIGITFGVIAVLLTVVFLLYITKSFRKSRHANEITSNKTPISLKKLLNINPTFIALLLFGLSVWLLGTERNFGNIVYLTVGVLTGYLILFFEKLFSGIIMPLILVTMQLRKAPNSTIKKVWTILKFTVPFVLTIIFSGIVLIIWQKISFGHSSLRVLSTVILSIISGFFLSDEKTEEKIFALIALIDSGTIAKKIYLFKNKVEQLIASFFSRKTIEKSRNQGKGKNVIVSLLLFGLAIYLLGAERNVINIIWLSQGVLMGCSILFLGKLFPKIIIPMMLIIIRAMGVSISNRRGIGTIVTFAVPSLLAVFFCLTIWFMCRELPFGYANPRIFYAVILSILSGFFVLNRQIEEKMLTKMTEKRTILFEDEIDRIFDIVSSNKIFKKLKTHHKATTKSDFTLVLAVSPEIYRRLIAEFVTSELNEMGIGRIMRLTGSDDREAMLRELSEKTRGNKVICMLLDETALKELGIRDSRGDINMGKFMDVAREFTEKAQKDIFRLTHPELARLNAETIKEIEDASKLKGIVNMYARTLRKVKSLELADKSVYDARLADLDVALFSKVKMSKDMEFFIQKMAIGKCARGDMRYISVSAATAADMRFIAGALDKMGLDKQKASKFIQVRVSDKNVTDKNLDKYLEKTGLGAYLEKGNIKVVSSARELSLEETIAVVKQTFGRKINTGHIFIGDSRDIVRADKTKLKEKNAPVYVQMRGEGTSSQLLRAMIELAASGDDRKSKMKIKGLGSITRKDGNYIFLPDIKAIDIDLLREEIANYETICSMV